MDLVDITTFDDIRATLGVSVDELEDATLSLEVYAYNLEAELRDIGPSLLTDYRAVQAKPQTARTEAESWFFQMTRLFATYSVSRHLTISLPLFSPKEITDGKASAVRYASDPYAATIKEVKAQYEVCRGRVTSAYQSVQASTPVARIPRVMFAVVSAGVDPVTGA